MARTKKKRSLGRMILSILVLGIVVELVKKGGSAFNFNLER